MAFLSVFSAILLYPDTVGIIAVLLAADTASMTDTFIKEEKNETQRF